MNINSFPRVTLILRGLRDLGGWRLVPVAIRHIRERGLLSAAFKSYQRLFWEQGAIYINNRSAPSWYEKNGCEEIKAEPQHVFAANNVLIVGSLDLPQCKKYRVVQKVEQFNRLGFKCEISHYRDIPRVFDKMQLATLVVFYRVPDDQVFQSYLQEAQRLGLKVGYDIDDPIFDSEIYEENQNLAFLSPEEKNGLLRSTSQFKAAVEACEFVLVSTPEMKHLVESFYKRKVYIWRNVLDSETLSIVSQIDRVALSQAKPNDKVVLSYMSGSRAHDADFETIESALTQILRRFPHVALMIGGYTSLSDRFDGFEDRIERLPFGGYQAYFSALARADINLVPLLQDRFNECKSAIRFLEASVLGIPTVASKIGDFVNLIDHGSNGFLVGSVTEWVETLDALIQSASLRETVGTRAKQCVMSEHCVDALPDLISDELITTLQLVA